MSFTRRQLLAGLGGTGSVAVAGCSGARTPASVNADVVAGPGGRLMFEPEELTVEAGETVTWYFDSAGHNVSCRPTDDDNVRLPEGAAPFSSYGTNESPRTLVPAGETYEHSFEVSGSYVYVCIPHVSAGMVGRIDVER